MTDSQLLKSASWAAVIVAVTLIAVKTWAYWYTDSVALLSTLMDSLLDAAASLVNLYAIRHALVPADDDHRFGHGKAEPLAGLVQSGFITASALFIGFEAVSRFIEPQTVQHSHLGIGVMVFTILLTVILVTWQKYVVRKTGSVAIDADSLHYTGDLLMNMGVIAALLIQQSTDWQYADPVAGLLIAVWIGRAAIQIGLRSLDHLMDKEFPSDEREHIFAVVMKQPGVKGMHDLRTRRSGRDLFIQLHLDLDGDLPLSEAHEIAENVEAALIAVYPAAEVMIHEDPVKTVAVSVRD